MKKLPLPLSCPYEISLTSPLQSSHGLRRASLLVTATLLVAFLAALSFTGDAQAAGPGDPSQPTALCLPGVYLEDPEDCLPLGPSARRTQLASQGLDFPLRPLPAVQADPGLRDLPYNYALLQAGVSVPIYPSLDDAMADSNAAAYIAPGDLRYISYINEAYPSGGEKPDFFQLRDGYWVAARDVASRTRATNRFQGLVFRRTPERPFGWILPLAPSVIIKSSPGYGDQNNTKKELLPYQVVQVYATEEVDGTEWYMVGPDEWIEQRMIGRVLPNPKPPEGVTGDRWIEINLFEQTIAVYDHSQLVFATLIASGLDPFYTRPGVFQIYKKLDTTPMAGAFAADRSDYYYLQDVAWTMYYDKARALHTAYWRTRFGYPQSHGCINLSPGDARWVYDWANEGDWVYVWDPSGETPTDPGYYGDGGA